MKNITLAGRLTKDAETRDAGGASGHWLFRRR
jgi:hypothetical protein